MIPAHENPVDFPEARSERSWDGWLIGQGALDAAVRR
jgi:hypothetical protein